MWVEMLIELLLTLILRKSSILLFIGIRDHISYRYFKRKI